MSLNKVTSGFVVALVVVACGSQSANLSSSTPSATPVAAHQIDCDDLKAFKQTFDAVSGTEGQLVTAALDEMSANARAQNVTATKGSWAKVGSELASWGQKVRAIQTPPEVYLYAQRVTDAIEKAGRQATQFSVSSVTFINNNYYQWQQAITDQGSAVTEMSYQVGLFEGLYSCR